jgi:hypothetical protein
MAKRKEVVLGKAEKPPDTPRFSVSFHADGDSMEDLHRKMGKAFTGSGLGGPKDDETKKDRKRNRGGKGRGHRELKRTMKKYGPKRG